MIEVFFTIKIHSELEYKDNFYYSTNGKLLNLVI